LRDSGAGTADRMYLNVLRGSQISSVSHETRTRDSLMKERRKRRIRWKKERAG
jgi:hypothetical protein